MPCVYISKTLLNMSLLMLFLLLFFNAFLHRYVFEVSDKDMEDIREVFGGDLTLPENFETTAPTLQEREFNSKPPSAPVGRLSDTCFYIPFGAPLSVK